MQVVKLYGPIKFLEIYHFYSPGTDEELNAVLNTCNNSFNIATNEF